MGLSIRAHPYTRAVCVEPARLFEQRAARDLVEAQHWADSGAQEQARVLQPNARLAQQRATAWHLAGKRSRFHLGRDSSIVSGDRATAIASTSSRNPKRRR